VLLIEDANPEVVRYLNRLSDLADGSLESAGSVSLGLAGEARQRLRAELDAAELPHRRRRRRVRPVEPAIVVTVDFHGPARGSLRDAVLQSIPPLAD
jgi:hypothetical protein